MSCEYVMEFPTDEVHGIEGVRERVVRCKDCKHSEKMTPEWYICCAMSTHRYDVKPDWFCADGESK